MFKLKYSIILLSVIAFIACSDRGKEVLINDNLPSDSIVSHSNDIQPIFNDRCAGCHVGATQGGLRLNNYQQLMIGGNSGDVVILFEPDSSILVQRIEGTLPIMPVSGDPLTQQQIDIIRQWIAEGAVDN